MASQQKVTIAKASFAASLLRNDPTSVPRPSVDHFHGLLDQMILECSNENVQASKAWIINNILGSSIRTAAFCKYLTALSMAYAEAPPVVANVLAGPVGEKASQKRKTHHLLLLMSDLLHETKFHQKDDKLLNNLLAGLQPQKPGNLINMLEAASSFKPRDHPKHFTKLQNLVTLWADMKYFAADFTTELQAALDKAKDPESHPEKPNDAKVFNDDDEVPKPAKEVPWMVPAMLGDSSTPWYDLPAGNLIPHFQPGQRSPIDPRDIKPLQFKVEPVEPDMRAAVEALIESGHGLFGEEDPTETEEDRIMKIPPDVDALGQPLEKDPVTGEMRPTHTYYGWSIQFAKEMQIKKKEAKDAKKRAAGGDTGRGRRRSFDDDDEMDHRENNELRGGPGQANGERSGIGTSNGAYPPRRDDDKEEHSSSRYSLGDNYRQHERNQDRESNDFTSRGHHHSGRPTRPPPRPYNHGSQSYRRRRNTPSPSSSGSQTPTHSPSRGSPQRANFPQDLITPLEQIDAPFPPQATPPPPPPPPSAPHHTSQFPAGPNGLPVPPRPAFYEGPWPPPPPPVLSGDSSREFAVPPRPGEMGRGANLGRGRAGRYEGGGRGRGGREGFEYGYGYGSEGYEQGRGRGSWRGER